MKTIVSALLALSVLAGIAAPASAFDAKSFYEPARSPGTSKSIVESAPRRSASFGSRTFGVSARTCAQAAETIGRLVSRFCGFILTRLRVSMARPR